MKSLLAALRRSQLVRSIFRSRAPTDRLGRVGTVIGNLFLHVHPVSVREHGLDPRFTWCMGGIAFFLFLVEIVTGILLMFYYRPTFHWAYLDMLNLRDVVSLGVVREIHRWAGHAMVIAVLLHMLRVFLTGSYKPPREFNWVVGVALLALTLLMAFTGYLLPGDQLALWAATVGSNMAGATPLVGHDGPGGPLLVRETTDLRYLLLGEREIGEAALNRFYVLHCLAIPLVAVVLIAVHFWRVRKDGGISAPL